MEKVMNNLNSRKNINYDAKSDVLYFGIRKGQEEEFSEIAPGVSVELDKAGNVIGVEVLNASKVLKPIAKTLYAEA
ncbi:MAG: hypothetical protein CO042_01115 [Parcubacteria group bacterium CG_4_9_14_0_2_um_filter_41_8]|nr:MAG: hypothetical protein CO042_01115 [Parcubacteria group bacterium CG_4_9_14_0_2_um_filter_41_8]